VMGVGIGVLAQPQLAVRYMTVKSDRELNRAVPAGGFFMLMMVGVAYVVGALTNLHFVRSAGRISIAAAAGDVEKIIPMYIREAMPGWFGVLFMLVLLSAAMSTLSGQFHAIGTSLGRDLIEQSLGGGRLRRDTTSVARTGVIVGIAISVWIALALERAFGKTGTEIVARGTAIFFGLCACAFLPMYVGALWSRRITRAGAVAGMLAGAAVALLWMLFVHEKESTALLACKALFGVRSLGIALVDGREVFLRAGPLVWAYVDPLFAGLPMSALVTWLVSLATSRLPDAHLARCFGTRL